MRGRQKWYPSPNDWHPCNTWILHPMYAFNAWTLWTHESFQPMHRFFPWTPSTHFPIQPINVFRTWPPQSIHPFNTWNFSTRDSFHPRPDFNTSVFQPVHRPSPWILLFIHCILPFNATCQPSTAMRLWEPAGARVAFWKPGELSNGEIIVLSYLSLGLLSY